MVFFYVCKKSNIKQNVNCKIYTISDNSSYSRRWITPCIQEAFIYHVQLQITLPGHLVSPPVFGGVSVAPVFSFLCAVICFVCRRPVSCVPNVASVSGLSIFDCPFGFP